MALNAIRSKSMLSWAVLCLLMPLIAEADVVLWPSDATELRAQPDSRIATLPDGAMGVETGVAYSWPGVRMDFLAGECDLTMYGRVAIAVSNTTDKATVVHLSIKGHVQQGQTPGGSVKLAPHAVGNLLVSLRNIPWVLDEPLELHGMRGYPAAKGGTTFDLRRTRSFHIFLCQDGTPGGFSVRRITASCSGVEQKVLSSKAFLPFVDMYGQFMHDDWPGKVHNDTELAAACAAEDAWLKDHSASPIPESDKYGGWAGGPQLKATGFFRTEKVDGKWWLVDPDGRLFFSLGVNAVRFDSPTGTSGREKYFSWLPTKGDPVFGKFCGKWWTAAASGFYKEAANVPFETFDFARANALRKYGADWKRICAERAHRRLRAWGLNTIANWSDGDVWSLRRTPYTISLSSSGTPRLEGSKGWWGPLPDPFNPEFETILRERAAKVAKTMRDDPWCVGIFVDNELSWNEEPRMEAVAERYFAVVRKVLDSELPNHLYLGCRIAWGSEAVLRLCAKYCDVVSVNIYDTVPRRDLPDGAVDRPMLIGEFHIGATDRGMFHTGLVAANDQAERAECYRNYVNACLDHPRYVGAHWFQWQDQPLTGRPDGENYAIGFVDITDAPHMELVAAVRNTAAGMYERRSHGMSQHFNLNNRGKE